MRAQPFHDKHRVVAPMPKTIAKKRVRRDGEELIKGLEAKIAEIKARAEKKRAKANPTTRYVIAAIRNMDKAMGATEDQVLRKTLEEARGVLGAYLTLQGIIPAARAGRGRVRRSSTDVEGIGSSLASYVLKNPGQRGEQIAEALGTDTKTMRLPMQKLIADEKVRTKGERRGMRYYPVEVRP